MSAELELAALKLFNAELEEENERLRVELAAAKSKIEQLRAGKEEPNDEKILRWGVDYAKNMMFTESYGGARDHMTHAVKEAIQQEYNMLMSRGLEQRQLKEYLKHDPRTNKPPKKDQRRIIPLELTAYRSMTTGDITIRLDVAGIKPASYGLRGDVWDYSPPEQRRRLLKEVAGVLFANVYGAGPPEDILAALAEQLTDLFHKEGLLHG